MRTFSAMSDKPVVIKFFAPVNDSTIKLLMEAVDKKITEGVKEFILLVSTAGGSVYHGLSAYNYLKGIPASFTTHNFGSVDSMGVVLYCGGTRRCSVPQARFLLHGLTYTFAQGSRLEEKQIEEVLKSLRIDTQNMAGVIAATTGKSIQDVLSALHERTALDPD